MDYATERMFREAARRLDNALGMALDAYGNTASTCERAVVCFDTFKDSASFRGILVNHGAHGIWFHRGGKIRDGVPTNEDLLPIDTDAAPQGDNIIRA